MGAAGACPFLPLASLWRRGHLSCACLLNAAWCIRFVTVAGTVGDDLPRHPRHRRCWWRPSCRGRTTSCSRVGPADAPSSAASGRS